MKKISALIQKIRSVSVQDQEAELARIIKENEKVILDLNRGQLFSNEDSQGKSLGTYASESYARLKGTPDVNLMLKGGFYGNFFLVSELPLIIWSYDFKTDDLVKKYGRGIFGLQEINRKYLSNNYIKDRFAKYQRDLIKL